MKGLPPQSKPPPGILFPLGGLKAKGPQLIANGSTGISWEKVTLTVDSGASDIVIPPHFLRWCAINHTEKVGTEYEVANGENVYNIGERRCIMRMTEIEKAIEEPEIASQVMEDVHKPLLAVSAITKQGHSVIFAVDDSHIFLKSGGKLPMRHVHGTYEIDIFVKNPGFTGQSRP